MISLFRCIITLYACHPAALQYPENPWLEKGWGFGKKIFSWEFMLIFPDISSQVVKDIKICIVDIHNQGIFFIFYPDDHFWSDCDGIMKRRCSSCKRQLIITLMLLIIYFIWALYLFCQFILTNVQSDLNTIFMYIWLRYCEVTLYFYIILVYIWCDITFSNFI